MYIFQLCIVLFAGGEDCSYSYVLTTADTVAQFYHFAGGKLAEHQRLLGFVDHNDKRVYLTHDSTMHTILHEIKHVKCDIHFETTGEVHPDCWTPSGHFIPQGYS